MKSIKLIPAGIYISVDKAQIWGYNRKMEEKKEYPNLTGKHKLKGGGHWRKYSYTLKDIATKKGVTIHAVRNAIKRGIFDPNDILSVVKYIELPKWGRRKHEGGSIEAVRDNQCGYE